MRHLGYVQVWVFHVWCRCPSANSFQLAMWRRRSEVDRANTNARHINGLCPPPPSPSLSFKHCFRYQSRRQSRCASFSEKQCRDPAALLEPAAHGVSLPRHRNPKQLRSRCKLS